MDFPCRGDDGRRDGRLTAKPPRCSYTACDRDPGYPCGITTYGRLPPTAMFAQTSDSLVSRPQAAPMEVVERLPPHGADDWRVYGGRGYNLTPSPFQPAYITCLQKETSAAIYCSMLEPSTANLHILLRCDCRTRGLGYDSRVGQSIAGLFSDFRKFLSSSTDLEMCTVYGNRLTTYYMALTTKIVKTYCHTPGTFADSVLLLSYYRKPSSISPEEIEPETPCPAVALATTRPIRQVENHQMTSPLGLGRGERECQTLTD
uniref:SFRICE_007625 n=1 Tax=Spodoptera frugiperda TaxID=7108 RepID=A0A2H1W093_SPOFR